VFDKTIRIVVVVVVAGDRRRRRRQQLTARAKPGPVFATDNGRAWRLNGRDSSLEDRERNESHYYLAKSDGCDMASAIHTHTT
jgi:hypothetical protein